MTGNRTVESKHEKSILRLTLADEAATVRLGEDIAAALKMGDVVALEGDLGAGKTTLARAIIRALADDPAMEVPSPTFTLVQAYAGRLPVEHFDLYRLADPSELAELGFDEAAEGGVALVEWPDRAGDLMPADTITVSLAEAGQGRAASIAAPAEALARLQRSLSMRDFLVEAGWPAGRRAFLLGDASTRAYERISQPGRTDLILMNSPRRADGPPVRDGKPYSQIAHLAETVTPFVAVAEVLRRHSVSAPKILAQDLVSGLLLIEDLGAAGLLDAAGKPIEVRYVAAAELLAAMHGQEWPRDLPVKAGTTYRVPDYDRGAMMMEVELFLDWFLPDITGVQPDASTRAAFVAGWNMVLDRLVDAEKSLVLRDYHSPNLIWRDTKSGFERLGVIDFQDAVIGPAAYDVASLALDARVTVEPVLQARIVDAYCRVRALQGGFDRSRFEQAYAIMAAQRNSKILGIFVRLDRRDGKPGYRKHLPRVRAYMAQALAHEALEPLRELYARAALYPGFRLMRKAPDSAMVLAAGLGRRMLPLTEKMPKPLVKIAGKPLIDWCLDSLETFGVATAVVNVHYLSTQLVTHLRSRAKPRVVISDETESLLDSGGGIVKALPILGERPFFVLNADTFWIDRGEPNLHRLALAWDADRMDILLMLADMESATGHSGKSDFLMDGDGCLSRSRGAAEGLIYAGAAIVHPAVFAGATALPHSLNLYFDRAISAGRLFGLRMEGRWITVGTPDAIAPAEAAIAASRET